VKKIGVVGGTGYTGIELLRLLLSHPHVQLVQVCSRSEAGRALADVYPSLRGSTRLVFSEPSVENLSACDLVFFATPNGVAMQFARDLLTRNIKVVDLAADFRFKDVALWQQWYEMEHACPELLAEAVYGLPELNREQIKKASLVGSAGCYTTAAQLAMLPLVKTDWVDVKNIIVDGKSGVSGAGRQLKTSSLFSECGESFAAYGVSGHRHQPEICHSLSMHCGKEIAITFVPHLVPMVRGIMNTLYFKCSASLDLDKVQKAFENYYKNEPFVDVLPAKSLPATKDVRASNVCRLAVHKPNDTTLVVLAVIDNLVKGASGQAVQNMNLMLGFEESCGLSALALYP
jgi:N-acetyl-gamma-glutamyl-phosphate reductase